VIKAKTLIGMGLVLCSVLDAVAGPVPDSILQPTRGSRSATLIPAAPQIAGKSWILMDANSGFVIAENNADERVDPASLTKLMTSYVVSHSIEEGFISNDDVVQISKNAWAQNPRFNGSSLMWVEPGKPVTVGQLHQGVVVSSGNDASVAIAEHVAGTEKAFADLMNQHTQALGMTGSHFMNAHGLPHADHYTTARDVAILSQAILRYPDEYALYSQPFYVYNGIKQVNRNGLLRKDDTVDGLKTGYTRRAGYCLAASAKRDDMRLVAVVMGARSVVSREQEVQSLLSYGFRFYATKLVHGSGEIVANEKVWKGLAKEIEISVSEDIYLTVPRSKLDELKTRLVYDGPLEAPLVAGEKVGILEVTLGEEVLATVDIVSTSEVKKGGLFKIFCDVLMMFFENLLS
jgi:D-alanyl-D-alanine carboxypeptidase (penicillin-binding protein 5/6)